MGGGGDLGGPNWEAVGALPLEEWELGVALGLQNHRQGPPWSRGPSAVLGEELRRQSLETAIGGRGRVVGGDMLGL